MPEPTPEPLPFPDEPPTVLPVWPEEAAEVQPAEPPLPPGPHIGWALLWFIGFFVFQIAVGLGLSVVLFGMLWMREGPEALQKGGVQALLAQPGAMLIMFLGGGAGNLFYAVAAAAIMFRRRFWRALALRGTHPLHLAFVFLLAVPMLLVAGACGNWAREILPDLKLNDDVYAELAKACFPLVLFAGCVLPGVAEELFFRGFLGRGLVARHGFLLGLLFSSVLFGVAHMNPPQIVATGLLGCGFHLVFLSSKSLVAPMLAHALNNGMAFTLMKYGQEIKLSVPGLTDDGHVPLTIAAAALAATGGLLLLFYYTRARWFLPDGSPWQPGYVTAETPPVELDARVRLFLPPSWTILLALVSYGSFVAVFAWQMMG